MSVLLPFSNEIPPVPIPAPTLTLHLKDGNSIVNVNRVWPKCDRCSTLQYAVAGSTTVFEVSMSRLKQIDTK